MLGALIILATVVVYHDFFDTGKDVESVNSKSIYFNDTRLLEINNTLRTEAKYKELHRIVASGKVNVTISSKKTQLEKDIFYFLEESKNFKDIKDLYNRGTIIASVGLLWNFIAGLFVVFFVWSFTAVILYRAFSEKVDNNVDDETITKKMFTIIWCIYTLLIFWVPFRLYSSWYINFYEMPNLRAYYAFILLLVIAIL